MCSSSAVVRWSFQVISFEMKVQIKMKREEPLMIASCLAKRGSYQGASSFCVVQCFLIMSSSCYVPFVYLSSQLCVMTGDARANNTKHSAYPWRHDMVVFNTTCYVQRRQLAHVRFVDEVLEHVVQGLSDSQMCKTMMIVMMTSRRRSGNPVSHSFRHSDKPGPGISGTRVGERSRPYWRELGRRQAVVHIVLYCILYDTC